MCGDTSDVLEGSTDAIELLQEKQENEFAVRKFTLAEADIKKTRKLFITLFHCLYQLYNLSSCQ